MEMEHDDLDEDIERLNVILQDEDDDEGGDIDGELRVLENNEEDYYSNASRPSTSSDVTASSLPTTSVCTDADESLFRFDPTTITAETCLAMNRAYQEVLLDSLRQIEMSLTENRHRQKELEETVDEKVKKTDKPTHREYSLGENKYLPYFKDKNGQVPPFNADVKLKEQMNEDKQHMQPKLGWTKQQRKWLIDAIKQDALEQIIKPLLNKQELEMEKLGRCKTTEEIEEAKARIEKLKEDIKEKQQMLTDELLKSVDSKRIDFMKIVIFTFNNKFTVQECESMWNNVLRPGINRDKWTSEEEDELKKLATKYEMRNWKQIAEELGTNRSPYQCLQHYQQNNVVYDDSEWTEEEDELLKEVVETCTYGMGKVHWHQVAYYIDRRSAQQCLSRWTRINPNRNLGRWTKEEDTQLLQAVQSYGGLIDWTKVQEVVPTRNASQCRERYMNSLNGNVLSMPFTYEEDKKLLVLHEQYGNRWVKIAEHFNKRTDNMLLLRFKRLMKWQRLMNGFYSQHRKIQKQLKHPAFKFGKDGMVVPKSGLRLRMGGKRGRPKNIAIAKPTTVRTELELLRATGGKEAEAAYEEIAEVKKEPVEEENGENEDEEESASKKTLQASLDIFLGTHNIEADDYFKQLQDKLQGGIVVPRPPPMKRKQLGKVPSLWRKQNKLTDVVQTQIDIYLNNLQEKLELKTDEDSTNNLNLYDQIAQHVKVEDEAEKRRMIMGAFGGKNPCNLSVRELLNISKCFKEHGKVPKNPKQYDVEPWEVEESDDDIKGEESSSDEEEEEVGEEEEPKPKKPRSEKQLAHQEMMKVHLQKYHDVEKQIKHYIQLKMDPVELMKVRGRRKQFLMYPKKILMKYRGLDEERRLNRKSLVLFMKTLDVDAKKAYFKAKRGKRRVSAMALLKSAEKANLKRAKTRRQKTEIQEAAQIEANMNAEISEASDFLLELKDELKINDKDEEACTSVEEDADEEGQGQASYGYNKSLPFIPPNQTSLRGMRSLLMEHRYLIDQAGYYFNLESLKQKLYELKQKGPNPLMGVLNAIGKTEHIGRRRGKEKLSQSPYLPSECQRQLEEARQTTAYQQLKARFQSVFTWPALMATVQPPKGKPLPKVLQQMLDEPKPSASTTGAAANANQADVSVENVESDIVVTGDVGVESGEVGTQSEEDIAEDIEDLPEEEAVEKLVDKIMAEYEKERSKKKRYLPAKKYRNFSDKRKQAFVEKERTKILKRLGLYEKMQEFKRRRQEAEQSVAATVASASDAAMVTEPTATEPSDTTTRLERGDNSSSVATETRDSITMTSGGCQTDMNPCDVDTYTEVTVKTEIVPKKKRGRPHGSKTRCFSSKSPERKSQRAVAETSVIVKQEQDFEMAPPQKKTKRKRPGAQYDMVRNLIPEKMSKIASQIPDLPILNEPVKEKVQKQKKPKVEKPKRDLQRVAKSKFGKKIGTGKTGPKTARLLKQLQDEEMRAAAVLTEVPQATANKVQIKTEPYDSDEGNVVDTSTHYDVVVTEDNVPVKEKIKSKIITSRTKKKMEAAKEIPNSKAESQSGSSAATGISEQGHAINGQTPEVSDGLEISEKQSDKTSNGESAVTGYSVGTPESNKMQCQNDNQQDKQQSSDCSTGNKPFLVAVPVMIGDTQQVAMIPFYPDKDGKITLPNGKKIDATASQDTGDVSLPVINFDQPVQVIDPSKLAAQSQTVSNPGPDSSDKSVSNNEASATTSSSDAN